MFVPSRNLGKRLFLALVQPMAQAQPETELVRVAVWMNSYPRLLPQNRVMTVGSGVIPG